VLRSFEFTDQWVVDAPAAAVADVLTDLAQYPRWWPQVRAVARLGPETAWVRCRSSLPYTLDLVLDAVSRTPPVVEVAVGGDLDGYARFTLVPVAGGTRLDFRQEVSVRGALALASYVGRPVLVWNHRRMMAGCRAGLTARLSADYAAR